MIYILYSMKAYKSGLFVWFSKSGDYHIFNIIDSPYYEYLQIFNSQILYIVF